MKGEGEGRTGGARRGGGGGGGEAWSTESTKAIAANKKV